MDKILKYISEIPRPKKIAIIGISIATLVIIGLVIAIYIILAPYFSNRINIVEKDENRQENIDKTIDVELPDIDDTNNIDNITVDTDDNTTDDIYKEDKKHEDIVNILLCGMDARNYETKSRSDTMILASYNTKEHTVKLLSFMRDSWVYLPERGWSRINAATAYGGTGLLINTINYNFDLDIQNYIQVKFSDFRIIIDTLGGIDVELTQKEINYINNKLHTDDCDYNNDIKSKPGVVHLNGAQALWHCRNRTIGNSDFERTERQREVLSIIINKLMGMSVSQATQLAMNLREHVNTNLDIDTIISLGTDALISRNITIESERVPFDGSYSFANKNGASVLEIDIKKNTRLIHEYLGYEIDVDEAKEGKIYKDNTYRPSVNRPTNTPNPVETVQPTPELIETTQPPAPVNNNDYEPEPTKRVYDREIEEARPSERVYDRQLEEMEQEQNQGESQTQEPVINTPPPGT